MTSDPEVIDDGIIAKEAKSCHVLCPEFSASYRIFTGWFPELGLLHELEQLPGGRWGLLTPIDDGSRPWIPTFGGMTAEGWIPTSGGMTAEGWIPTSGGMTAEGWTLTSGGMTAEGWIPTSCRMTAEGRRGAPKVGRSQRPGR